MKIIRTFNEEFNQIGLPMTYELNTEISHKQLFYNLRFQKAFHNSCMEMKKSHSTKTNLQRKRHKHDQKTTIVINSNANASFSINCH